MIIWTEGIDGSAKWLECAFAPNEKLDTNNFKEIQNAIEQKKQEELEIARANAMNTSRGGH